MNNLSQRVITGIVGAAVLVAGMVWNIYSLILVLFILSVVIHFEYLKTISQLKGKIIPVEYIFNLLIGAFVFSIPFLCLAFDNYALISISVFLPVFFCFFIFELFANREHAFQNIGLNILGIFYCVLPFCLLLLTGILVEDIDRIRIKHINLQAQPPYFVLGYFLIVWTNDTMAYFAGKAIGKHKLFERISPKKTWEGFLGGFICGLGMAIIISSYFPFLSRSQWLIVAIIISVFGTLGDLVESMLKRSLHIKDSGSILPGHGGFLDRFDASLIAAPFVFLYIVLDSIIS